MLRDTGGIRTGIRTGIWTGIHHEASSHTRQSRSPSHHAANRSDPAESTVAWARPQDALQHAAGGVFSGQRGASGGFCYGPQFAPLIGEAGLGFSSQPTRSTHRTMPAYWELPCGCFEGGLLMAGRAAEEIRSHLDPTSIPPRSHLDPASIPPRSRVDPTSTPPHPTSIPP